MENFPCQLIRNFSIIAHIDHGKSTLADRLLELTGTIDKHALSPNKQVLDKLKVERERGITVKAQTASMIHEHRGKKFLLNLIDTPGHVDFSWEVSRSLAACDGALFLVDATQGVQAQSISVYRIAQQRGLTIVPILNKIDMPAADPERICAQLESMFDIRPSDVLRISAKTGHGVDSVLRSIIDRISPPPNDSQKPFAGFLFDSSYDRYRGVISLVNVKMGVLRKGDKIASCATGKEYEVTEVGVMHPEETPTDALYTGQVGFCWRHTAPSMVYAGVYPINSNDFPKLEESINRLTLTDRSVTVHRESSSALGQGCRLGFLGSLHMDVFRQRLEDEHNARIIVTAPTVPYKIIYKDRVVMVSNPSDFPDVTDISSMFVEVHEPMVKTCIICPADYVGEMMDLCFSHRAEELDHGYIGSSESSQSVMLTCKIPLNEVVTNFFDKLKSRSSGFASFDYEDAGYQRSDLTKMMFLINSRPVDALALIVHKSNETAVGRALVKKLHKVIPRQLFEVPIQAVVGKRVIARETLSALRADVTAGLSGGHYERKLKHLENQKESKKRMKKVGNVELPQEAFFDILSTGST